jgi:ribosomal protein S27AE
MADNSQKFKDGVKRSPDAFANGFDYFCVNCGHFFSAQITDAIGNRGEVSFCPRCGEDLLAERIANLIDHCVTSHTDTVNFYSAFPPDKPLPHSRTGATPEQVRWIVDCVISDQQKDLPITVKSLADELGYDKNIVEAVFGELHIGVWLKRQESN